MTNPNRTLATVFAAAMFALLWLPTLAMPAPAVAAAQLA